MKARITTAGVAALLVALGVLWIVGWLPGVPLRAGPLEGTNFEQLRVRTKPSQAGVLWGSLVLHNSTGRDMILEEVTLAGKPQGAVPSAGPYLWGEERVALLDTGMVSGYQLPLPATWKIPPRLPVAGFHLVPQQPDDSVEVVYEFPVPDRTTELHGITVRYRTGGLAYRRTFDVDLTICAPADPAPCQLL